MEEHREHKCPFCRAEVKMEDINVSKDLAVCRSCGRTMQFSMLFSSEDLLSALQGPVPRWLRVEDDFSGCTTITYQRPSPFLFFLIPFTAIWSGGSMWGIYGAQIVKGKFDLSSSLFGIPFLIGTIILVSVVLFLLVGKWVVKLDGGSGKVFVGVGPFGYTRHFSYGSETIVGMRDTDMKVNNVTQKGIALSSGGEEFVFGSMIKDDAKRYIAAVITSKIPRRRS